MDVWSPSKYGFSVNEQPCYMLFQSFPSEVDLHLSICSYNWQCSLIIIKVAIETHWRWGQATPRTRCWKDLSGMRRSVWHRSWASWAPFQQQPHCQLLHGRLGSRLMLPRTTSCPCFSKLRYISHQLLPNWVNLKCLWWSDIAQHQSSQARHSWTFCRKPTNHDHSQPALLSSVHHQVGSQSIPASDSIPCNGVSDRKSVV